MAIQNIFVVGAGLMGSGIAQNAITSGYNVTINDQRQEALDRAKAGIEKALNRDVEKGRMTAEDRDAALARLSCDATLDSANRLITFKDGRETSLTAREFEFLTYMATHPNRVITRDELLRRVWDVDPRLTDTRSVEMTVMRLRDKLGAASASPLETLRSQGYRWNSSFVS